MESRQAHEVTTGSTLPENHSELQAVYESMYDIAPGKADFVPGMLLRHASRPGFRVSIASIGCRLIGFAYGFTGEDGQEWTDEMRPAMSEHDEWLGDHFEFAEFGVAPDVRRRGIGTAMYSAIFEGLPHDKAVLTVRVDNLGARAFYRDRGWEILVESFVPSGGHGPYAILGLRLR